MLGHRTVISGVAANSDYILTAGYDNKVICWDATTAHPLGIGFHDHLANKVALSPCGNLAVSASSDYSARVWNIPSMELMSILLGHTDDVDTAVFSPNGEFIATASYDDSIGIFNLSGEMVAQLYGHEGDVSTVFWKGDRSIVSTGDDGSIRIWDVQAEKQVSAVHSGDVETDSVCNGPKNRIYAGNDLGEILTLNSGGGCIEARISAHNSGVKHLLYVVAKNLLVSAGYDGRLKLWNCADSILSLQKEFKIPLHVWPRSCAHVVGQIFAFATFGSVYASLDAETGKWNSHGYHPSVSLNAVMEHRGEVVTVGDAGVVYSGREVLCKTGRLNNVIHVCENDLLVGGQSGEIISVANGKVIYKHRSPINGGGDSPLSGDIKVVFGTYSGEIILFGADAKGHPQYIDTKTIGGNSIKDLAFGTKVGLAMLASGKAVIFDPKTYQPLKEVEAHDAVANACVSTSSGFASVGRDRMLVLWNDNGEVECQVNTSHQHSIKTMCLAGQNLVLGDYRGYVSIYDTTVHRFISYRRISETGISCLSFHSKFGAIASSYDGTVYDIRGEILDVA